MQLSDFRCHRKAANYFPLVFLPTKTPLLGPGLPKSRSKGCPRSGCSRNACEPCGEPFCKHTGAPRKTRVVLKCSWWWGYSVQLGLAPWEELGRVGVSGAHSTLHPASVRHGVLAFPKDPPVRDPPVRDPPARQGGHISAQPRDARWHLMMALEKAEVPSQRTERGAIHLCPGRSLLGALMTLPCPLQSPFAAELPELITGLQRRAPRPRLRAARGRGAGACEGPEHS